MGVSKSPAELAGKLRAFADALADTKPALEAAGLTGKTIFATSAGSVLGTKPKGKRRAITARYEVLKGDRVWIGYTGPAHLINNPTKAHTIYRSVATARGKGARKANAAAKARVAQGQRGAFVGGSLKLPDGGYRKAVRHPGTPGKHFAEGGKALAIKRLPPVLDRVGIEAPLRRIFA